MFTIPGFDPKKFTDEEILKKMTDLYRRLMYANRFSISFDMIGQIQNLINALEWERRERMMKQMFDMREKIFPEVIESDPGLKELEENAKEKEKPKPIISGPEIRKSKRPISQPPHSQGPTFGPKSKSFGR